MDNIMDSQNLKQRITSDPKENVRENINKSRNDRVGSSKRERRMAMAKRGLKSLAIALSLPVSLTLLSIFLGSMGSYGNSSKPFWFPPMWALHMTCLASSFLMGFSAWLIWADGGFHNQPGCLWIYLLQILLSVAWDPIVFGVKARQVGLVVCLGMLGAQLGCSRMFKQVNPIAGDLMKPCLAWSAFLAIVNLKLVSVSTN